jgi:cyclopropane-fatty-acyl-phospholipid synthase
MNTHVQTAPGSISVSKKINRTAPGRQLAEWFERADVRINGTRPWDFQVRDERVWNRMIRWGTLGLGESYMDGWWDCAAIDEMVWRLLRNGNA